MINELLNPLLQLKKDIEARRKRTEQQLWIERTPEADLYELLSPLTKDRLNSIRQIYELRGLSSLRKGELAAELSHIVPLRYEALIYQLTKGSYTLLKEIVENPAAGTQFSLSYSVINAFMEMALIFPGKVNGQKQYLVAAEFREVFQQLNHTEIEAVISRNSEWVQITYGLVACVGYINSAAVIAMIETLTNREIDILEYYHVMKIELLLTDLVIPYQFGYKSSKVTNIEKLINDQMTLSEYDYYSFTKSQLINASDPDYYVKTPEIIALINYLENTFEVSRSDLEAIIKDLLIQIRQGQQTDSLMTFLDIYFDTDSLDSNQILTVLVKDVYNTTRQWVLKGYTPNEIGRPEYLKLPPVNSQPAKSLTGKTQQPIRVNKVGRNDSCPCGSGKKFKKCCGK